MTPDELQKYITEVIAEMRAAGTLTLVEPVEISVKRKITEVD